jgi:Tol biopolymer transport system component
MNREPRPGRTPEPQATHRPPAAASVPARRHAPADGPRPRRPVAVVAALVGLVLVGVISFGLLGGPIPDLGLSGNRGGVAGRTPDPVKPFTPPERTQVRGTILFVKAGNVWAVSGNSDLLQISSGGTDASPVWAPGGKAIYFLETRTKKALVPYEGHSSPYTLEYPVLSRMATDGSRRTTIKDSLYTFGANYTYFYWLLQPAMSPDGTTFALVSDAPDPFQADVTLQTLPVKGGQLTKLSVPEDYLLGHNDPAWSPRGDTIAFTYNHRDGAVGRPRIGLYDVATRQTSFLTDVGYGQPAWSPNGTRIAAVRTTGRGRDIVILDAAKGTELLRVTSDGQSFAPIWSPAGDQIAFLRATGLTVDLVLVTLRGSGALSVEKEEAVTSQSRLDGASRPSWYVPASQMPTPAPTRTPTAVASGPAGTGVPSTGPAATGDGESP